MRSLHSSKTGVVQDLNKDAEKAEHKGSNLKDTKNTGNPRKQITPEVRKAADDALKWATEPIGSLVEKGKKVWSEHKETIHTGLDMVGFAPGYGEPADFINGLIYIVEQDYANAAISMAAVIPVFGDMGKFVKYGGKALEAIKKIDKGGDATKLLREAIKKGPKLSKKDYKLKGIFVDAFEKYVKENADEAVEAAGKGVRTLGVDELVVRKSKYLDGNGDVDWKKWAPNGGRVPGTIRKGQVINTGTIIDRYGNQWGKYTSPVGVPYEQRALPYIENPKAYHKYEVLKPIEGVTISEIAPAFEQIGGGIQYELPSTIKQLIKEGFIREVK